MINRGSNQNLLPQPFNQQQQQQKKTMPLYVSLFLLIVLSAAFQRFVFPKLRLNGKS